MAYYHFKVDYDKLKIYVVNPKKQNTKITKWRVRIGLGNRGKHKQSLIQGQKEQEDKVNKEQREKDITNSKAMTWT